MHLARDLALSREVDGGRAARPRERRPARPHRRPRRAGVRRPRPAGHRAHPPAAPRDCTRRSAADGEPLVDGRPWSADDVRARVEAIVGPGARLVRNESAARFDILPLLVATDGAIAAFGRDGRRLRPNLIVGGVADLAEREWEGRVLRIGPVLVGAGRSARPMRDDHGRSRHARAGPARAQGHRAPLRRPAGAQRGGDAGRRAARRAPPVELLPEAARRAIL